MMRRLRNEDGVVLVTAIILLTVVLALGMALVLFSENQQTASARETASEQAFNLAEAALNAQIGELSSKWPAVTTGKEAEEKKELPFACTEATSAASNYCPTAASLNAAYPASLSPTACPAGAPADAWGSPLTNKWTTYVRDDLENAPLFNSAAEKGAPLYDANGNEKLWVRAVGVVRCTVVSVISLVARQQIALNFPKDAAAGNWFHVTNEGNKVIVNTAGEKPYVASQPGEIAMRCEGIKREECEVWSQAKKQISPNTTGKPPLPSTTLNEEQLEALKAQAQATGTFRSAATGNCPTTMEQLSGLPAYVEGCGALQIVSGVSNSKEKPGFLVLADGTLTIKGSTEFWGVIYARNPQNSSGAVVTLGGKTTVFGEIIVDGNGGIEFGSDKANLIYDPRAVLALKTYAGATPTRNTFRVLPSSQ
jgi:Tfp pilus assembly protein PilX